MAENRYDLDSLLAEIRKKKAEIEKDDMPVTSASEKGEADVSVTGILESLGNRNSDEEQVTDTDSPTHGDTHAFEPEEISDEEKETGHEQEEVRQEEETEPANEEPEHVSAKEERARRRRGLRSISRQLTGSFDAIPGEYTGDFYIGHPIEKQETDNIVEIDFSRPGAEEHPVFVEKTASFNVIPQVDDDREEEFVEEEVTEKGELRLDGEEKLSVTQGILNIKESLDDNFRELFGDTVIVEHSDRKDR